jgi:chitinase
MMMSIGGWNAQSKPFSIIAADKNLRSAFAQNILNNLITHDFDGFDFDWEYPAQRDTLYASNDKANFVELLKELKSVLSAAGKLLTIAVGATESSASLSYDIPNVAANVDFINLMSYDLHGTWDGRTGITAPLYAATFETTSYQKQLNVDAIVKYWLSKGCPKDKLILGIPLYGLSFTLSNPNNFGLNAPISAGGVSGVFINAPGFLGYNEICFNLLNNGWTRYWENTQKVPYAVKGNQWVGYDDAQSIAIKLNYIAANDLGGAMFWSIETADFSNLCGDGKFPLIRMAYDRFYPNVSSKLILINFK